MSDLTNSTYAERMVSLAITEQNAILAGDYTTAQEAVSVMADLTWNRPRIPVQYRVIWKRAGKLNGWAPVLDSFGTPDDAIGCLEELRRMGMVAYMVTI